VILSDRDIQLELESGRLVIDPIGDPAVQIQPASVDLRLATDFIIFRAAGQSAYIHPGDTQIERLYERVDTGGAPFILHPGQFVLASTMEWVKLPDDLVGRVDGRSSLGRLGVLMHATAGFIDPGFNGKITLELSNVNQMPVVLKPGMRVCQISFDRMSSPAARPYGTARNSKYQCQTGAQVSLIHADFPHRDFPK
jgi:dCTP deaminase